MNSIAVLHFPVTTVFNNEHISYPLECETVPTLQLSGTLYFCLLSPFYLFRYFKEKNNLTIYQYLLQKLQTSILLRSGWPCIVIYENKIVFILSFLYNQYFFNI